MYLTVKMNLYKMKEATLLRQLRIVRGGYIEVIRSRLRREQQGQVTLNPSLLQNQR